MALGTSTNVNKSAIQAQQEGEESVINEEDQNIEAQFGYYSDEDSVFYIFENEDNEKKFPRSNKKSQINKDSTNNGSQVKKVMKRFTEKSKTYEFLVKFEVVINDIDSKSDISEVPD